MIGKQMVLGFLLLAALMAMVLSVDPPTGADSDVPVSAKGLSKIKDVDGGYSFTLAAT